MSDLKFTTNIPEVLIELGSMETKLTGLNTTFEKVNRAGGKTFDGVTQSVNAANQDMGGYITKVSDAARAQDQAVKSTGVLRESMGKLSEEINVGGVNLAGLVGQFKQKATVLRTVIGALGSGSGALKAFRIALISTGIGALLVALGSLVALLTRNQKAMDFISKVMAGFGAVVNVVIDRLVALAAPIGKVVESIYEMAKAAALFISGDFAGATAAAAAGVKAFEEAADGAKTALRGMGDEMAREAKLAFELEGNLQKLTRQQQLLNIQTAGSRADIASLKQISENTNQAYGKRIAAAQKAYGIEQSLLQKQTENQRQLIANSLGQTEYNEKTAKFIQALKTGTIEFNDALKQVGLNDKLASEFQAVEEQVIELFNKEQESLEKQVEISNQVNSIRKEAADKAKAIREAEIKEVEELVKKYDQLTGALTENATAIGDDQATAEEKIIRVRDRSLAQLQDLKNELNDLTVKLKAKGQVVGFDTDEVIRQITDYIEVQAERDLDAVKFPALPVKLDLKAIVSKTSNIVPVNTELGLQFDDEKEKENFQKKADELFNSFRANAAKNAQAGDFNFWKDVLGLDPEKDKEAIDGIKSAASEILGVLNLISSARLEAAAAAVEEANITVDAKRKALDVELAIAELGFASNVDRRKKELEDSEKAQAKAIEQQKKAQKQQLVLDTITQTVALITSSANIFKSLSGIPFVGIPLAIGVIATMFAAFAKVKSDAFKAAKFGEGGEGYIGSDGVAVGRSHGGGGIGIEIEGGELFRTDGKRFSVVKKTMTAKHSDLLKAVNVDDTAEIARLAIQMALDEGIRFESMDLAAASEKYIPANTGPQSVNVSVSGMDNRETNRLLGEQLKQMKKPQRWSDANGTYEKIGNVTFKTSN